VTDKTGADAAEFRAFTEDGRTFREPVITEAHKQEMRRDLGAAIGSEDPWVIISRLYGAGWSYRLIAQFCGMGSEDVSAALFSNGRSLAGETIMP
jgi:hypothetical protein